VAEDVGDDARAEIVLVVEQSGPASLTRNGEGVGWLDGDFEVERQRDGQAIEARS
jgi:hypothetical protein